MFCFAFDQEKKTRKNCDSESRPECVLCDNRQLQMWSTNTTQMPQKRTEVQVWWSTGCLLWRLDVWRKNFWTEMFPSNQEMMSKRVGDLCGVFFPRNHSTRFDQFLPKIIIVAWYLDFLSTVYKLNSFLDYILSNFPQKYD